jgi:hypothetical protein
MNPANLFKAQVAVVVRLLGHDRASEPQCGAQ